MEYITKSKRLKRFLYNLGFNFILGNENGKEVYKFQDSTKLQESINFYYKIRKTFEQ